MPTGTVKWFDPKKGFGFVVNEKDIDVFVHYTNIESQGFRCLKSGQKVHYKEQTSHKGVEGIQVQVVSVKPQSISVEDEQELESSQR